MRTVNDYLNFITSLHRDQEKFMKMMSMIAQPFSDLQSFANSMPLEFDVDRAVGIQLDAVGEWVGEYRPLPIPLSNFWFTWGDEMRGWGRGVWKGAEELSQIGITYLDDPTFRSLIKAKIAANFWKGTALDGQRALDAFFADSATLSFIHDRQDLTIAICVAGKIPEIPKVALLSGNYIKLKPVGVKTYHWFTSVDMKPLFGFGMQNAYVSGWGTGAWATTGDKIIAKGAPQIPHCDFMNPTNSWLLVALGIA